MADHDHDDGGDDGNEDVEAEAQVEFKPLIEVCPFIWRWMLFYNRRWSVVFAQLWLRFAQLPPEVEIKSGEEDEDVVFKM